MNLNELRYELEFREELQQSLNKLGDLAIKATTILESIKESKDDKLLNGLEEYASLLEQEKEVIDEIVIIVNNMFENGIMDLTEANVWYSKLYEDRKIAEASELELKKLLY